jgi:hypothetical protein
MIRDVRTAGNDLIPPASADVVATAEQVYLEVRRCFALHGISPHTDQELSRVILFAVDDAGAQVVRGALVRHLGRGLTLERFSR